MLFFSAGSLGARHSIPERIFLRGSFGFCMPGSYAVYVRAAGLQLQIPLPSVLQERFPGSVVEFREILLRKDSVIEKAEYRQSIAGAVQTVILTTYIFVECLYALIYFQIFLMAGLRFFILQESFEFRQKGTAFRKLKNRGTACCFRKESVFLSCAKYRKHNFVSSGYCWETVSGVFIPSYGNTENSLQRHFSSTRTGRCVRSRQLSSKHKKFRREQRNASAYRYIVNFHL